MWSVYLISSFFFLIPTVYSVTQWTKISSATNWKTTLTDDSGQFVIALNDQSNLFYSSDYGTTWNNSTGIYCWSGGCNTIALSNSGVVYKLGMNSMQQSLDYGHTFTTLSAPFTFPSAVTTDPTGTKVMIAEYFSNYRIHYSSDSGASFTLTSAPAKQFTSLCSDSSMTYVVAVSVGYESGSSFMNHNQVYYSHNSGTDWTLVDKDFNGGTSLATTLTSDASGKYVVLGGLADDPVKIFYSSDFGVTWNRASPNTGYSSVYPYGLTSNPTGQYAAIACWQGVYLSTDYGATWSLDTSAPTSSPTTRLMSLSANSDFTVLYLQTSTGLYVRAQAPTSVPTSIPSSTPSVSPTIAPSAPTVQPTFAPSSSPTVVPTIAPTTPTVTPSLVPTFAPTLHPTTPPSVSPTLAPTLNPTISFQPTVRIGKNGNSNSPKELSDGGIAGIVIGCVVFVAVVGVLVYMFVFKSTYQPPAEKNTSIQMP
jgi:hypothetical protein